VAKRIDSLYRPGARSPMWRKVKIRPRLEFVVGGWHPGERGRAGQLGSLLLGYYLDAARPYAGKVGTGVQGP
jgi:bifunctional non-homologous end joining protein LigD